MARGLMHPILSRAVLFLLIIFVSLGCSQVQPPKTYLFNGNEIFDSSRKVLISPIQSKGDKVPSMISLLNMSLEYNIFIPYSETWSFTTSDRKPLLAEDNANSQYISVMIYDHPGLSEREYLNGIIKKAKRKSEVIHEKMKISNVDDVPILSYRSMLKKMENKQLNRNNWIWNYWVACPNGKKWYVVHWSKRDDELNKYGAENEEEILRCLTFFAGNHKSAGGMSKR